MSQSFGLRFSTVPPALLSAFIGLAWMAVTAISHAQGFSASVSPPRAELQAAPGQTVRQILDIQQAGAQPGRFRIYTNDWTYGRDNTVAFSNELAPGSCRPWVALSGANSPCPVTRAIVFALRSRCLRTRRWASADLR